MTTTKLSSFMSLDVKRAKVNDGHLVKSYIDVSVAIKLKMSLSNIDIYCIIDVCPLCCRQMRTIPTAQTDDMTSSNDKNMLHLFI